jgi:uncharacterized protein (DUF736 family)
MMTEGIEIGAGWTRKGEASNKEYLSLSIAVPEIGSKKLYPKLDEEGVRKPQTSCRDLEPR